MNSDPKLLEAFRRQCASVGPSLAMLAWLGQAGVEQDDLIDIANTFTESAQ